MLRLVEVALFLVPFGVVVVWRLLLPTRGAPLRLVAVFAVIVALLAGALLWLRHEDAAPAGSAYIPSHMEDGQVIPSSEVPR